MRYPDVKRSPGSKRWIVVLATLGLLHLLTAGATARAQETACVSIVPEAQTVPVGGETELEIRASNVNNLYGVELHLTFDSELVEVIDADPVRDGIQVNTGDLLAPGMTEGIAVNQAYNSQGRIDFAVTLVADDEAVSGSGTLATIGFRCVTEGTAEIRFENPVDGQAPVKLADGDGRPITVTWTGGLFEITAEEEAHVDLVDGWNMVGLTRQPDPGHTAFSLAAEINRQGGNVTQVFWWNAVAGTWDFWLVDLQYGIDFDIEVGYGYLLRNTSQTTWSYYGLPLPAAPGEVPLVDGWNLIALPVQPATAYTASTLAADINDQGGGITQVFWWNALAGTWDFWLVDLSYGTDFDVELGEGYLLNNGAPVTWTIQGN